VFEHLEYAVKYAQCSYNAMILKIVQNVFLVLCHNNACVPHNWGACVLETWITWKRVGVFSQNFYKM